MSRIVSVWLPHWPIERLARKTPGAVPDEQPFALVAGGARGITVAAVNRAARAAGIAPGQPLADARAALPSLATRPAESARDRAGLLRLALWAGRYGPARNLDGADGLWVDTAGVAHLFGGEERLLADLVARLAGFGLTAAAAAADTLAAAAALARFAAPRRHRAAAAIAIAPPGGAQAALAPLPVEALRLDADSVLLLKRLGLRRIGQLYGIPRAALERRFRTLKPGRGAARALAEAAGSVLCRLDQATASAGDPLVALVPPPPCLARRVFMEPLISPEGIAAALGDLADELAQALADRVAGTRRVRLGLYRTDGTQGRIRIATSRPTRDPAHLLGLLGGKLAGFDAGFGVDVMTLEAAAIEALDPEQAALAGRHGAGLSCTSPALLIDRLSNRLGPGRVQVLAAGESHVPERADRRRPALEACDGRPAAAAVPGTPHRVRPPLLLAPPEPIDVVAEVPEGAPIRFTWRRLGHRVTRAEGPERIAPEWWHALGRGEAPGRRTRDYYRLEDEHGCRFWVFRDGLYQAAAGDGDAPPRWFLHGLFG